ncbi:MAG TPA: hypothetical protein VGZ47_15340 [Gemmataceae bacterium]|nr:hypothetical protein [Gemmataceae bacterium]
MLLNDDFDERTIVSTVHEEKSVVQAREEIGAFKKKLLSLKENDFVTLFGKSQPMPPKTYAMPLAQPRMLTLSGLRHKDPKLNKNHTESYIIKDVAGLEVWYSINGQSPAAIVIYFPVDKDFPKFDGRNLEKRLAWDKDHFKKLQTWLEKRRVEIFPWEIDEKELEKLNAGDFAVDAKTKLAAWIESGKKNGYDYRHSSDAWEWYSQNGKLIRRAYRTGGGDFPLEFAWYQADGRTEFRKEVFNHNTGNLWSRVWRRPGTDLPTRSEGHNQWCWYDNDGKPIRVEWDTNGDGIPDWFVIGDDDIKSFPDWKEMEKKRKPLKVEDSWAINPKLIPPDSRISDQPDLRVPIRRAVTAEASK